jgi:hypothetical protein
LTNIEAEPNETNLRSYGQEMSKAKGSMMSLGRVLMLSQDTTLAVSVHELVAEAEETIWTGQQQVRAALRKIGATSDVSEAGSVAGGPARAGFPLRGGGVQAGLPEALPPPSFLSGVGQKRRGGN